ncbi:MAG: DUF2279 domain-containing protein [Ichthyobacteriaceae bacterium]|nr:DUF2279 domain-containing protein [Ichthyobacteriaceae bacterium]
MKFTQIFILLLLSVNIYSQSIFTDSDTLNTARQKIVAGSIIGVGGATLIGLNQMWYKNYPRSSFHFINDNSNWLQMDKVGHATTAYYMGYLGMELFKWSGTERKKAILYGGSVGFVFLTAVEVLDGLSKEWGASMGDVVANASGTTLLIGQELLWNEQRVQLKYSYHNTKYAQENPNTLGGGGVESMLKDYNGQTYWLSLNLWSFFKHSSIPKWLNVSVGYGAEGMYSGAPTINDMRYRKLLLGLDLQLSNIDTGSEFFNTVLDVLNVIKIPFPALEYNVNDKFKFHYMYF